MSLTAAEQIEAQKNVSRLSNTLSFEEHYSKKCPKGLIPKGIPPSRAVVKRGMAPEIKKAIT